eukprot:g15473.t1
MKEGPWVPAALTAVSGCTGYAAMCWSLKLLTLNDLSTVSAPGALRKVMAVLLIHEAWVTFQHANVLFNPFCQQLDRRYGVAMLRRGQHWVIASVLVMYWSREVASMLLCLPYISLYAQVAVFISVAYHMVKMLNICKDAQRCWSPCLGIMKLLIDHWHFQSFSTKMISLLRMALQGYDTFTHVLIVRDMIHSGLGEEGVLLLIDHWHNETVAQVAVSALRIFLQGSDTLTHVLIVKDMLGDRAGCLRYLHLLFMVWIVHAALNQATQKSTATLVVETWRKLYRPVVQDLDTSQSCRVCSLLSERKEATACFELGHWHVSFSSRRLGPAP